ncbi:Pilin (type 1 fimbria component protein) [Pseudomonas sp. LAMO17WK12:I10]|uniref:fimbrial protein n=1 Tax=unclassified Pseudomonas TaxID=196821 RepID=UPI000BCC796E|nr:MULTISPECIES: fimbrial protein [unclassified Pseudomonas]PXX73153.1 type 1 fimbria pilin [Pseudomonas sp. LAMO17WK12:I9]SNY28799.1 Pilin (type 1 fimbria component protein) [Pseudomonas sp. LAMO17WK12:I10]
MTSSIKLISRALDPRNKTIRKAANNEQPDFEVRLLQKRWKTFGFIVVSMLFSGLAQASNICGNSPSGIQGTHTAPITVGSLRPYYDVPVGGILGTGRIDSSVTCNTDSSFSFVIQMVPNSQAELGNDVCQTPLDGVGIRFRDIGGEAIECSFWGDVLYISNPRAGVNYNFSVSPAVEFVRTKDITTLSPGLHNLRMPSATVVNSYLPASTNGQSWGNYTFNPSDRLLVSRCMFAEASRTVDFQVVSVGDLGSNEKLFNIGLRDCGDQMAAELFNNLVKMKFSSAMILPDGTLGNSACGTCAEGVAIEVSDGNGNLVPLNRDYQMRTGAFTISGDTIDHRFKARLKATGGTIKTGRIDSLLTVILSSI